MGSGGGLFVCFVCHGTSPFHRPNNNLRRRDQFAPTTLPFHNRARCIDINQRTLCTRLNAFSDFPYDLALKGYSEGCFVRVRDYGVLRQERFYDRSLG
jgi:hypothetical protein